MESAKTNKSLIYNMFFIINNLMLKIEEEQKCCYFKNNEERWLAYDALVNDFIHSDANVLEEHVLSKIKTLYRTN